MSDQNKLVDVIFISPSTLKYDGVRYKKGDRLQVTRTFYDTNYTRLKIVKLEPACDSELVATNKKADSKPAKPKARTARSKKA